MLKTTTSWLQDQIDHKHADGGGTVIVPPGSYHGSIIVRAGVSLVGEHIAYGYNPGRIGSTRIVAPKGYTGWVVDVVGGNAGVSGVDIIGNYDPVGGPAGGLRANGSWSEFSRIHFDGFRGPALKTVAGNACTIDKVLAINSCLDRDAHEPVGVMDIAGNDHYISRVEASASLKAVSSEALNVNAWVMRGANTFYSDCVGEFADRGVLNLGSKNRLVSFRGDRNFGIGFETRGGGNTHAACMAIDNSRGVNSKYPAFLTSGGGNAFSACRAMYLPHELPTYAFEDTVNSADPGSRNTYDPSCGGSAAIAVFKGEGYLGSTFSVPNHPVRVGAGNPTTLPVDRSGFLVLTGHTEPTTITDFINGFSGQTITVIGNPLVTIAHGQGITTRSKAPFVMEADRPYQFSRYNGAWREH